MFRLAVYEPWLKFTMVFAEAMGAMANAATRTRAKIESLILSLRTTKVPPWGRKFVLQ
jgi:hypothetical protein